VSVAFKVAIIAAIAFVIARQYLSALMRENPFLWQYTTRGAVYVLTALASFAVAVLGLIWGVVTL
jgi:hypothetical protein